MADGSVASNATPTPREEPARPPPRIVLASEALREDVAPLEPGEQVGCRVVQLAALSLLLLGVAIRFEPGATNSAASWAFAMAFVAFSLSALPLSYVHRALTLAAVGSAALWLGLGGVGLLYDITQGSTLEREALRLLTLWILPPALLFRARYR